MSEYPGVSGASNRPLVAVRSTHEQAQRTIEDLRHAGVDMRRVSLLGKAGLDGAHAQGFCAMEGRILAWGNSGGFWIGTWGLLAGAAVMLMPPLGIVAAAGPVVAILVAAFEGASVVGGVSALAAALGHLGLTHEEARRHERDLEAGRFLILVHDGARLAARALAILSGESGAPADS